MTDEPFTLTPPPLKKPRKKYPEKRTAAYGVKRPYRHRPPHPKRAEYGRKSRQNRRAKTRVFIDSVIAERGGACIKCGARTCLEFAHRDPFAKKFDIASCMSQSRHKRLILEEMEKCDLLCRPCHTDQTRAQHAAGIIQAKKGPTRKEEPIDGRTRECCTCRAVKDLSQFYKCKGIDPFGRQRRCKDCMIACNKKRAADGTAYINSKKLACVDCGAKRGLEFDHVRGVKHRDVSLMVSCSRARIDEEIAKCDVVCVTCHRIRTFMRANLGRCQTDPALAECT